VTELAADCANCLFCKIIAGKVPAELIASNEDAIAIRDINPQAALHALVIPKRHFPDVVQLAAAAPAVLAQMVALAGQVAQEQVAQEQAESEFRLIFNTGAAAGQSVFHVHGHVLSGQQLAWNPA
jgi:histidine triad (HIT) family protein